MALSDVVLKNTLLTLFNEMEATPMSKETFAEKLAKVITDQIKTAAIPTSSVIISVAGGVSTPAVGTPNPAPIPVQ
jgi:flagellar basal body-associated protein FliL